ncbi:hypothetical protein OB236_09620 [Paenibacillus sp. WQ 127069]|uniref:Uncharacterized protein n=1 Tax=Paenibacillus baimaensis TaxID=2982185 RepID=A0ABT2UEF7_9BACL|nr:hypothetical protein [Paenibacillus sp. WQ 127069]MCU6792386.1 hypothetical protein [Paenibacillus sp. WQ 127069]
MKTQFRRVKVGKTSKTPETRAKLHKVLGRAFPQDKEFFSGDVNKIVDIIKNLRNYYSNKIIGFINYYEDDNTTYSVDFFYDDGDINDSIESLSKSGFLNNREATNYGR